MAKMRMPALIVILLAVLPAAAMAQSREPVAFFYNALWDSSSNDINASTLQRIQMSNTEYQEAKNQFIQAFVGAATSPAAAPVVAAAAGEPAAVPAAEIRLSLDPKVPATEAPVVYAFDVATVQAAVAEGNAPDVLAEWSFYYWQVYLWEQYVSRATFMLSDMVTVEDVERFAETIQEQREPVWVWTEIDPEDQEPAEWVQASADYPELEEPAEIEVQMIESLRAQAEGLEGQMAVGQTPLAARLPATGTPYDLELAGIMRVYHEIAYALDALKHDQYWGVINDIRQRQEQRDRYSEWVDDRQAMVSDFAQDWARKYDGSEFAVDGVQFLVSEDAPIEDVPPNARNIVIDKAVVPYDLLNDDGTLKRPVQSEE